MVDLNELLRGSLAGQLGSSGPASLGAAQRAGVMSAALGARGAGDNPNAARRRAAQAAAMAMPQAQAEAARLGAMQRGQSQALAAQLAQADQAREDRLIGAGLQAGGGLLSMLLGGLGGDKGSGSGLPSSPFGNPLAHQEFTGPSVDGPGSAYHRMRQIEEEVNAGINPQQTPAPITAPNAPRPTGQVAADVAEGLRDPFDLGQPQLRVPSAAPLSVLGTARPLSASGLPNPGFLGNVLQGLRGRLGR